MPRRAHLPRLFRTPAVVSMKAILARTGPRHPVLPQGLSIRAVADALTVEGIVSPGGGSWQPSTLHRVPGRAAA